MKTYKILIVDNDIGFLHVINQILINSDKKYEILNAQNGFLALEIIENEKPDLLITDWDMPQMTGIELIEKIQENSQTLLMPVIVCTGIMQRSEDLCFALEKGAIDFLRKPIEPIELLARINSQIRFAETYKQLTAEREERAIFEKNQIEEKLIQQETELSDRLLLIAKYNEILKNTAELLKKMPTCVNKNICKPHIEGIINNIKSLSFNEKWEEFYITFNQLYPSFFTKMVERYPNLTKNELKLCALLKLNLSTKEISTITQQSIRAVEMSRFRLRTKMGLDKNDTINNFLQ